MNCWEYMSCPPEVRNGCPSYPKHGRECWKMPSTMCAGGRYKLSSLVEKVAFCRLCEFYKLHAVIPEGNSQQEETMAEEAPPLPRTTE
jgi:hypothetical protein